MLPAAELGRQGGDDAYHYDGAASRLAPNTIPGTGFRVFSQTFGESSPDQHRLAVNGRTVLDTRTTVGRAYSAVATNVFLGRYPGSSAFNGDLTEWIIYDRALTPSGRLQVEEYLRQRAGLAPFVAPGSLALDRWEAQEYDLGAAPPATWLLDQGGRTVVQPAATDPSVVLAPFTLPDRQVIRARLSARNSPGFMGFVFGYQGPGRLCLFDWQQADSTHPGFGPAPRGLRLRAIPIPHGGQPTGADLWSSPDPARVTTLRTHDAPWVAGREYELILTHQPGRIELAILDGATEIVGWEFADETYPPGQFGYYVNGLAGARFGQVTLPGAAPYLTSVQADGQGNVTLDWIRGVGPYLDLIEAATDLGLGDWIEAAPTTPNQSETLAVPPGDWFFRIPSPGVAP